MTSLCHPERSRRISLSEVVAIRFLASSGMTIKEGLIYEVLKISFCRSKRSYCNRL